MTHPDTQGVTLSTSPLRAPRLLCAREHAALKASEENWAALSFAGIQPIDRQLFDSRHCPVCGSTVVRVVSLTCALELVFEDLLSLSPPRPSTARSAALLTQWVTQHVQPTLGQPLPPGASEEPPHARSR
jgi:hypothetical protein